MFEDKKINPKSKESFKKYLENIKYLELNSPRAYKAIPINERLPPDGVFVTTIDSTNNYGIYQYINGGWNMRDIRCPNNPNNNFPIIFWLERNDELLNN